MEKKKLYIGSSIGELNKKGKYDFDRGRSIKIHINHSDKTFQAAEAARLNGDEERGYILYMRYLDIFQKVRASQDFKKDSGHYSLLLGTKKFAEAIDHAEKLSCSLRKRYEDIKNGSEPSKADETSKDSGEKNGTISPKSVNTPKSNGVDSTVKQSNTVVQNPSVVPKGAKDISCEKLHEILFSTKLDVLMLDIRPSDEFQESCIRHPDCINVPKTHIKPGTVCKRIEEGITNIDHLDKWKNRAIPDIIVMIDWNGTLKRLDDLKDPLRSLNDALVKWEQEIFLKRNPVVLTGGYIDWLDYYPQFSTNSKVARPTLQTRKITSVTSLTDFHFNDLLPLTPPKQVDKSSINNEEQDSDSKEWDDAEVLGEVGKRESVVKTPDPTSPAINNLYPSVPQNVNLSSKKTESSAENSQNDITDSAKPTASTIANGIGKKNIPAVDRSKKPSMPSRNLKPQTEISKAKNIMDVDSSVGVKDWPPASFVNGTETPSSSYNSESEFSQISAKAAASIDRIELIKKKKEEDERKTKELEDKKKLLKIEAYERQLKEEAEEQERQRKNAEKEVADLMRNIRKNEPTKVVKETTPVDVPKETNSVDQNKNTPESPPTPKPVIVKPPEKIPTPAVPRGRKPVASVVANKKDDAIKIPDQQKNLDAGPRKDEIPQTNKPEKLVVVDKSDAVTHAPQPTVPPTSTIKEDKPAVIKPERKVTPKPITPKPKDIAPQKKLIKTNDTAEKFKAKPKPTVKAPISRDLPQLPPSDPLKRQGSTNLPLSWEKRLDRQTGRYFYLDHKTKTTHWTLPNNVASKITKAPLRDENTAPAHGGLKRSSSSPNIAQLKDDTPITDYAKPKPSIPDRENKPRAPESQAVPDDPNIFALKLDRLHPAPGGSGPGLCGLMNLGNTCYMNSVLQCMFNTTLLVEYFLMNTYKDHINRQNFLGSGGEITDGFSMLMKASWGGQYRHLTPRDFRHTIAKFNSRFGGYTQQDSQELLLFLMDGLHEDLNEIKERSYVEEEDNDNMNDNKAARIAWEHHNRLNKSIIVQLFQGQFKATVQCLHCKKTSRKFDVFMYLSLPVPSQNSCSIHDCIKKFSEVEKLSGDNKWRCPNCKTERDAVRKMEIWKLPPVLFIHFKRFSFCGRWGDKVQTSVKFPEKNLNLNEYVKGSKKKDSYQLYAVSHHHGASLDSGHYVASCKSPIDNNWYKYDDHEVSRTSVPSGPSTYILCYTSLKHSLHLKSS